jgi:hypothetical protein
MKNKMVMILLISLFSISSFAGVCKDSHLMRAYKKSDQSFFGAEHKQILFLGGAWTPLGLAFLSVGTPAFIATGAGAFFLVKGLVGVIQEPRYKLIVKMILAKNETTKSYVYKSKLFNRVMKKAIKVRPYITNDEILDLFVSKMDSGEFCKNSGKPFSYKKMERQVLKSL